jgi:hypothetical protein
VLEKLRLQAAQKDFRDEAIARNEAYESFFSSLLQKMGVFMRDITAALLAIGFVLYSLIALLSVDLNQDSTSSPLVSNQERISELGLRVAFQR